MWLVFLVCGLGLAAQDKKLPASIENTRAGLPMDNTPANFHLAFAGKAMDGMTITWETDADTATQVCIYGLNPSALNNSQTGFSRTYGLFFTHIVTLSGLQHNTRYYYSCGATPTGGSPTRSFLTAPEIGSKAPYAYALVGDMGIRESNGVIASLKKHQDTYQWLYHVGDVGYADDWMLYVSTYDKVYATFMSEIESIASEMAYMVLPGNHEASCQEVTPNSCPQRLQNFTAYRSRWQMPCAESGGTQNMWYSFDYGLVHFVQISTETDFPGSGEGADSRFGAGPFGNQLAWLKADLTKAVANRANVPWIVVAGHRPLFYSSGADVGVVKAFLPFMSEFDVDFYWSAHKHQYERYWPILPTGQTEQKNYVNPKATIYIVNGAGGNAEGHDTNDANADYLAYRNKDVYGWTRVTVFNATTIKWEFIDDADNVIDEAVFWKQR